MIPVGIGAAASVRVGRAVGRTDVPGTRLAGIVAIASGGAFMALAALVFLVAPAPLAGIITNEPAVIEAVVPLLFVAAVFQLSDGVQAVAAGALRGAGDTRFALLANLGGHYLIGLPVGVLLAFQLGLGARGLWWGLSVGLTVVAVGLTLRFLRLSAGAIARV
jgi:MATE family multidrug resistance protein